MSKVGLMRLYLTLAVLIFHWPTSGFLGLMNFGGDFGGSCRCPPSVGLLMVILITSLPPGCRLNVTFLPAALSPVPLSLGSQITTLALLVDSAASGRMRTFFPSRSTAFIGNGC